MLLARLRCPLTRSKGWIREALLYSQAGRRNRLELGDTKSSSSSYALLTAVVGMEGSWMLSGSWRRTQTLGGVVW